MNNTTFAFLLTIAAGLSTMFGALTIFIKKKDHQKIIAVALSFASGVMICTSITDLIPESIALLRENLTGIAVIIICVLSVILGVVVSMIIDYYLPSEQITNIKNKSLYKVGLISMIAIILHNLPEGIATFIATNSNVSLGLSLAISIALHNIPEGIGIAIPIYYSTNSKRRAILFTLVSALSEPLGAVLAFVFLKKFINDTILGILFAFIAGIMLQISFCELLPEAKKYKNSKLFIISFVTGIIFMLIKFLF